MTKALFQAVYDDPSDRDARSVLADALLERGDPRGELIALQLAGRADAAKERALIAKHGPKWAGPIGAYFVEPIFEDGFFAGGMLRAMPKPAHLRDPAWRLVRVLAPDLTSPRKRRATEPSVLALAERPELVSLTSMYGIEESSAGKVSRPLTALGVVDGGYDGMARRKGLRTLAASGVRDLAGLLTELAKTKGTLREVVIMTRPGIPDHGEEWTLRLQRDGATGPFTRLRGTYRTPKKGGKTLFAAALEGPLGAIPASWLESISLNLVTAKPVTLPLADRRALDAVVARFTSATEVEVPWSAAPAAGAKEKGKEKGTSYELRLRGPVGLLDAKKFGAVWKLFADEAGQHYDAFTTAVGGAHRKLVPGALAKWAANPRCRELEIVGEEAGAKLMIGRTSDIDSITTATLVDVRKDADALLAWLVRVVDLAPFESGTLEGGGASFVFIGPPRAALLEASDLGKARKTRHGFLVEGDEDEIAAAVKSLAARGLERARGWTVAELAEAKLAAVANELGLARVKSDEPLTTALFGAGDRQLAVVVGDVERPEGVDVELRLRAGPHGYRSETVLSDRTATSRAAIEKQLVLAAKKLPTQAPKAWAKLEKAAKLTSSR